jgi:hypothetical protein
LGRRWTRLGGEMLFECGLAAAGMEEEEEEGEGDAKVKRRRGLCHAVK